jgi:asparagine synthase (glutamine-hydrolysing)
MCGIAGEFAFEGEQVTAVAGRMTSALRHRGPDSSGHYLSPARNVILVNTRLAIVDVGGGTQPLTNEDGSVRITFNGEIYGFAALARQLESRGHRLRTRCDTEVIVHLYEEYGEAFVEHLRGEFAFAPCDRRQHTLWLGRDRFGVKPLYYALSPRSLLFGSAIRPATTHPLAWPRSVRCQAAVLRVVTSIATVWVGDQGHLQQPGHQERTQSVVHLLLSPRAAAAGRDPVRRKENGDVVE